MREKQFVELSTSLQASNKSEMMVVKVKDNKSGEVKNYFLEYPTNIPPSAMKATNCGVELSEYDYDSFKVAFKQYQETFSKFSYTHPPTFIYAYMLSQGLDVTELGILT